MAVTTQQRVFWGLSTDTKPTVDPDNPSRSLGTGARFYEIDTGSVYDWNGAAVSPAWIASLVSSSGGTQNVHQGDLDFTKDVAQVGPVFGKMYNGVGANNGIAYTVKKSAKFTNSTANTPFSIVPLVSGKQIQAVGYQFQAKGTGVVNFNFQDSAASPVVLSMAFLLDKSGAAGLGAWQLAPNALGSFVDPTTASKALMGNIDANVQVDGVVMYIEV